MAIQRSSDGQDITVTFVLADYSEPVSVVGSFNDWTPGTHPFVKNDDGSYSVTIVVSAEAEVHFRYLGANGRWFDDPDADEITPDGSVLRPATEPSSAVSSKADAGRPPSTAPSTSEDGPSTDADPTVTPDRLSS